MKIGLRAPSPEKRIKARTTGRVKRAAKSSINPLYGKKGMGYLKDPERAIKNRFYHKLTVDPLELAEQSGNDTEEREYSEPISARLSRSSGIFSAISMLCSLFFITETLLRKTSNFTVYIVGIVSVVIAIILYRIEA